MQQLRVGIDPDVDKNGVAIIDKTTRDIELHNFNCGELVEYLQAKKEQIEYVIIEASWLLGKASFRIHPKDSKEVASLKGLHVGRNQGIGMALVQVLKSLNLTVIERKPLKKIWGKSGKEKISHDELKDLCIKMKYNYNYNRTNQEQRDALLLLIFHY